MNKEQKELMELDGMRQKVIEESNLLNDITPRLDAVDLVTKMNDQRTKMIDYIIALEKFIQKHHTLEEKAK